MNAVPGLNQQAQSQADAASQVQLQQQLGAAPATPGMNVTRVAQAAAPQAIAQAGQQQLAIQQQGQQQLAGLAQAQLQQQAATSQIELGQRAVGLQKQQATEQQKTQMKLSKAELESRKRVTAKEIQQAQYLQQFGIDQDNRLLTMSLKQRSDLQKIGRDTQDKILDSRLRFERDEMGRKFTNERQLADWKIMNMKSEQEFQRSAAKAKQDSTRFMELLTTSHNQISQALEQEMKKSEAKKDFQLEKKLALTKRAMQKKIKEEAAAARNRASMWRAGGMIVGAVAGSFTPAGPVVGAQIGAAAGEYMASTEI